MYPHVPALSDSLTRYLTDIRKFSLLDEQEEQRLAIRFYEENDLEAAQTLVTSNLRFVVKIAAEYRNYGMKMLDLIQEGNVGLMIAVKKFNPYRGFRLISYAVWWIRAQIQNYIVSAWSLLKIGTTQAQRKLFFKLKQTRNALARLSDGEEDSAIMAHSLDVSELELQEMEQRMLGEVSLDAERYEGDGATLLDSLVDDRPNQEAQLADLEQQTMLQRQVAHAMNGLNEKERYVVEKRIVADEPATLQEIANHFAISRERVRQIEENALRKMKALLQPALLAAAT
ncbi:RNA polymerase sigma factor RpoH [Trichlorobacter ammonificans]|uniref:RNA polymerase sigma factor n=1 Tax=Trichlorobacter ammonificans TaxID=2916410 RepID=A0ABM9D9X0_9BACT|nr:RNA polymerase sigma factor RpoH [Trichlorobacter ammonificans]CAH2032016.1 RNA polymerase sigma-B factor [Trichlorobacter ammonificans]